MTDLPTGPCASGIYIIRAKASGGAYVGSAVNIAQRWRKHRRELQDGTHKSRRLLGAFHKYGNDLSAFDWEVLELCPEAKLIEREAVHIVEQGPRYNVRLDPGSNMGLKWTPEQREKITAALKATTTTPEGRKRLARTAVTSWQDPEIRARRIAEIKAKWTPEKRAAAGAPSRLRGAAPDANIRWADPAQREAHSQRMRERHAATARSEADLRQHVEHMGWQVRSMTGTKNTDRVTLYCPRHDYEASPTWRKVLHAGQGCRHCGFERSSDKQKGRPR